MRMHWTRKLALRRSFQAKLVLTFTVIMMVTLSLITWIWYSNTTNILKRNASEYVMDNIENANHSLDFLMNEFISLSTLISMNQEFIAEPITPKPEQSDYERLLRRRKVESFLETIYSFNSSILAIQVVGEDGTVFSAGFSKMYYDVISDIWNKDVSGASGKALLLRINLAGGLEPESDESYTVVIGQAVLRGGKVVGTVYMYVRYSAISSLMNAQSIPGTELILLDENGGVLYGEDEHWSQLILGHPKLSEAMKAVQARGGSVRYQEDGKLVLIYRSDHTRWTTVGLIPIEILIGDSQELRDRMYWASAIVMIIIFLLIFALSQQTTKNIKRLSKAMKAVESGDLSPKELPRTKDEIGLLSIRFMHMMDTINSLIHDIKRNEKKKREADLKALQLQIHPHFLYNTLNTIRYLAKLQHAANIEQVTGSLIHLLRSAAGKNSGLVTLSEELQSVQCYMDIQNYKYVDDIAIHYDMQQGLEDYRVLPLLLQPLVENALLHGIEARKDIEGGLIRISIRTEQDDSLVIAVVDNGPGMPAEMLDLFRQGKNQEDQRKMFGIGLHNVHERIQLTYGSAYGLDLDSRPGEYTKVTLRLPFDSSRPSA
ncbi:two-component system sensor histidine kinase YesM [Paenibacillus rhizosphaerae]|uniref:histidine kinase n=2 Tax=Paenibacillus rhizosphaerae TaxID=297318 RepID=A0A839TWB2_9BACL|nr:two-component system sensor histidine kinase YesM [Paenibacillus rhizosphaerae]